MSIVVSSTGCVCSILPLDETIGGLIQKVRDTYPTVGTDEIKIVYLGNIVKGNDTDKLRDLGLDIYGQRLRLVPATLWKKFV
jgi:hypothetical protein